MFELVLGSGVVVAIMLVVAVDITVTTDGEPGDGIVSHVVAGALVIAILMGGWYVWNGMSLDHNPYENSSAGLLGRDTVEVDGTSRS